MNGHSPMHGLKHATPQGTAGKQTDHIRRPEADPQLHSNARQAGVVLKIGRSAVRPRPWPQDQRAPHLRRRRCGVQLHGPGHGHQSTLNGSSPRAVATW